MRTKSQKAQRIKPESAQGEVLNQKPVAAPAADPTNANADQWPIFASMEQCAARTGIPKNILRGWKSAGAPGFKFNRVYFGELLPWMSQKLFVEIDRRTGLPPVITWEDVIAKQKYLERAGVLIEFNSAMSILRGALAPIRTFLLSFAKMMGPRCNPSDPVFAQTALEVHVRQGMQMIADAERDKISKG